MATCSKCKGRAVMTGPDGSNVACDKCSGTGTTGGSNGQEGK